MGGIVAGSMPHRLAALAWMCWVTREGWECLARDLWDGPGSGSLGGGVEMERLNGSVIATSAGSLKWSLWTWAKPRLTPLQGQLQMASNTIAMV